METSSLGDESEGGAGGGVRRPSQVERWMALLDEGLAEQARQKRTRSDSDEAAPTQLCEHIKIMKIGQGAYGTVWLGQDLRSGRLVALKKLKLSDEREGFPKNAIREIALLRELRHPNIVRFFGVLHSRARREKLRPEPLPEAAQRPGDVAEAGDLGQQEMRASAATVPTGSTGPPAQTVCGRTAELPPLLVQVLSQKAFERERKQLKYAACGHCPSPCGERFADGAAVVPPPLPFEQSDAATRGSVWMSFEYLPFDLSGIVEQVRMQQASKSGPAVLSAYDIRVVLRDTLEALQFCHSRGVLHRDLKTANLLVDATGRVQLADFGLARAALASRAAALTNRVVTLWYRPPELLLGGSWYGASADLWSAGCILGELALGKALFAGDNEARVLRLIAESLGRPDHGAVAACLGSLPLWKRDDFNPWAGGAAAGAAGGTTAVPGAVTPPGGMSHAHIRPPFISPLFSSDLLIDRIGEAGVDLLRQLLAYDPARRPTAREALGHPWLASLPPSARLSVFKFEGSFGHAFNLRRDRGKNGQNAPAGGGKTLHQQQAAAAALRRHGPRILNSEQFLDRMQRAAAGRAPGKLPRLGPPAAPADVAKEPQRFLSASRASVR